MFNLIVSGNGESWENPPYTMDRSRFGEYSGEAAEGISLKEPDTLDVLIGIPTLLAYEIGASGENARLVRYGRITAIKTSGRYLQFDFEIDENHGYITRTTIQEHSESLGITRFEDHRTHWAIKDGAIPQEVIDQGQPEPPERDIKLVSGEYREALRENNTQRADALRSEITSLPPSPEKATEFLRGAFAEDDTFSSTGASWNISKGSQDDN